MDQIGPQRLAAEAEFQATSAAELGAHVEADSFFYFVVGGYIQPLLPESHRQNVTVVAAVAAAAAFIAGAITGAWLMHKHDSAAQ